MAAAPEISVVVPTHRRPLRLRWLLNALEGQTLDRDRWEAVVVHDGGSEETNELLASHPLAAAGVVRSELTAPGSGTPSRQRNAGWRAARAPLIAFTDDDCEPPPDWLENALRAARRDPGAIIQGRTKPHPSEAAILAAAPRARTIDIDPPAPYAQTCNIVYPRDLLDAVDGFDEEITVAGGEDTDLALRARAAGAAYVGAPELLTHHAVDTFTLPALVRLSWRKWQYLPLVVRRHPEVRSLVHARYFWRRSHLWLPLALAGILLARRSPLAALLLIPYLHAVMPKGRGPARALLETPSAVVVDLTEAATLLRGSVRHGAVLL